MNDFLEKFRDKPVTFYVMLFFIVIGLAVSVIFVKGNIDEKARLSASIEENNASLVELRTTLHNLNSDSAADVDPEDITYARYSASESGKAVAFRQNRYLEIQSGSVVDREGELVKNAEGLDVYFADDSKNARTPWFSPSDTTLSRFTWEFKTNYVFASKNTECLWICKDKADLVVAFALGTYDADANTFSGVKSYSTQYGMLNYQASGTTQAPWEDYVIPDVPDGYHVDENGNVLNANGEEYISSDGHINPSEGDADWAAKFEELFKQSQAYRDQLQKEQNGGG